MFPPEQLHFTPFCHPELVSVMLVARLTKIGILKEGTDAKAFADNAYIFFDDVPDAPESDASTDTATKSTKASSASFQTAAAAEAEDDCCSGKITKPAQNTNAKA